jgi:hypothetical protein
MHHFTRDERKAQVALYGALTRRGHVSRVWPLLLDLWMDWDGITW